MSQALAASFQGQLSFAQGQFLGSELKPGMAYLSSIAQCGLDARTCSNLAFVCFICNLCFEVISAEVSFPTRRAEAHTGPYGWCMGAQR